MKRTLIFSVLSLAVAATRAQSGGLHPIAWEFSAKKIADKTYEVHLTAQLQSGWHAYSQQQPKEAVAQPTEIHFKHNPLVGMIGKIKEIGSMERWKDEATGIMANQYDKQVDFVQVVKIKGNIRTNVSGSLTYQVCTNEMCLPPKTESFTVNLDE
jgi:thiol:disulfide interchange protein DsbD